MKFLWFFIVVLLVGISFFTEREPPAPRVTETQSSAAASIPTSVGIPPQVVGGSLPKSSVKQDEDAPRLQKIAGLARFALPTQDTREALMNALSNPELQASLSRILEASDFQTYQPDQEKLRMNAVSVLGLILKHKDVRHRDAIVGFMRQRILAVDFDRMKDIRVKQSVYGDITEMLMILKQYDFETFEDVAQRIGETNSKALQTALAASR
jgi:hypothetical protein